MYIYIDESGNFAHASQGKHSYSFAGALTIPERLHDELIYAYQKMKTTWGFINTEPKGRELSEEQIFQAISLLIKHKARFHVCVTDMAYNAPHSIHARKMNQALRLTDNLTRLHKPCLVEELHDLQAKMVALPGQLFVQLVVMTELVGNHLRDSVIYYALNDPPELGNFKWVIDQKDRKRTIYENMWQTLLPGFVQSMQFSEAMEDRTICVEEGDYSHFGKYCDKILEWPRYLPRPAMCPKNTEPIEIIDVGKVIRDSFSITDSSTSPGLQLSDIVTNAFRRAISGRLEYHGWQEIGKMMFRWRTRAILAVHFADDLRASIIVSEEPARSVIAKITQQAGNILDG